MYTVHWTDKKGRQYEREVMTVGIARNIATAVALAPWCSGGFATIDGNGKVIRVAR